MDGNKRTCPERHAACMRLIQVITSLAAQSLIARPVRSIGWWRVGDTGSVSFRCLLCKSVVCEIDAVFSCSCGCFLFCACCYFYRLFLLCLFLSAVAAFSPPPPFFYSLSDVNLVKFTHKITIWHPQK